MYYLRNGLNILGNCWKGEEPNEENKAKESFYKIYEGISTIYQEYMYNILRDNPMQALILEIAVLAVSVFFKMVDYFFSILPFYSILSWPARKVCWIIPWILPIIFGHVLLIKEDRKMLLSKFPESYKTANAFFTTNLQRFFPEQEKNYWQRYYIHIQHIWKWIWPKK